jgi:hypothetical protein
MMSRASIAHTTLRNTYVSPMPHAAPSTPSAGMNAYSSPSATTIPATTLSSASRLWPKPLTMC